MSTLRRIVVNDYAGHPFQIQLSRQLAKSGCEVVHLYCSTNTTPHGDLAPGGLENLSVEGVSTGSTFDKYSIVKRSWQEVLYGYRSARIHRRFGAEAILAANVPVLAVLVIRMLAPKTNLVLWLQDIQAGIASLTLNGPKRIVASIFTLMERSAIRSANAVVAIADSLAEEVVWLGVNAKDIEVIENWAPIDELPVLSKKNDWSVDRGLESKFVFLYSGTLGTKHRPELLLGLAEQYANIPDVRIVVVSEGKGADWLKSEVERSSLGNVVFFPFQPYEQLPQVLATADVLVTVLEQQAGSFSIPSKVLSYLCSRRAILASLPAQNSCSELVESRAKAGLATAEDEIFYSYADRLFADDALRREFGMNGREYAEETFEIEKIGVRFLELLTTSRGASHEWK